VIVAKARRFGDPVYRRFAAAEKMPAVGRARTSVALDKIAFFCGGEGRRVVRIEANVDDFEFFSGCERQRAQRPQHAVAKQGTRVLAAVVSESQDDGAHAEVIAEPNRFAGLVAKFGVERGLFAELLFEVDRAKGKRPSVVVGPRGCGVKESEERAVG